MIERLKVNQFSTTPSAIRRLMKAGDNFVNQHDLSSLKTIGSGTSYSLDLGNISAIYCHCDSIYLALHTNSVIFACSWRASKHRWMEMVLQCGGTAEVYCGGWMGTDRYNFKGRTHWLHTLQMFECMPLLVYGMSIALVNISLLLY